MSLVAWAFFSLLSQSKAVSIAPQPIPSLAVEPVEPPKPVDLLEGIIEKFTYDPVNKRDPFLPFSPPKKAENPDFGPVLPLQRFDLEQLQIVGIIWDVAEPKALVVDPQGNTTIVTMNERIGRNNGYVAAIREGEVVIVEAFDNAGNISYRTKVLRMVAKK